MAAGAGRSTRCPRGRRCARTRTALRARTLARPVRRRPGARRGADVRGRRACCSTRASSASRRETLDAARRARARGGAARSGSPRCSPASTSTSPRTARRCTSRCAPRAATRIETGGEDVVPAVHEVLDRMARLRRARALGRLDAARPASAIRTVVNIGIGGSYLGPEMAALALAAYVPDDLDAALPLERRRQRLLARHARPRPGADARDRRVEDVRRRSRR